MGLSLTGWLHFQRAIDWLFIGKGHRRFFALTALFAAASYAIGIALMAPFIGVLKAGMDVGLGSVAQRFITE